MNDPELELIIASCRAAYRGTEASVGDASRIRWDRFASLAQRHRVAALSWHGLGAVKRLVPRAPADRMRQFAKASAAQTMRMAFECARLRNLFDRAGVDILFVKGVTLGSLAYPDPFLKASMDIDILAAPDQLGSAASALRSAGYQAILPATASDERLRSWHYSRKESVWLHGDLQFQLDLHTRLADHPALIPGIGIISPRQSVSIAPGIELPTLAPEALFAYLCVHGASSAWFRLKWICDFAALLDGVAPAEIERLYVRSQHLGAGRAAAQALLLADHLFNIGLPVPLVDRLHADHFNSRLVNIALRQLKSEREPLDRKFGTMSIHLSQLFLLPGAKNFLWELERQAGSVLRRDGQ